MRTHSNHINIYRLKHEISKIPGISLASIEQSYEIEKEATVNGIKYRLYIQRSFPHTPKWCRFLDQLIDKSKPKIRSSTSSFILFAEYNSRAYALTGGFGHTKIKDLIDEEFGLHMALRLIDPKLITGIFQKSMKGDTRQIYRAVIGYKPELDLENFNRILRAVEGKTSDRFFGMRVSGRASLSFNCMVPLSELSVLFDKLEEVYKKDSPIYFPKSYELITDDKLLSKLDNMLIKETNDFMAAREDRDRLYIELKDINLQFRSTRFELKVKRTKNEFKYFSLEDIRDALAKNQTTHFNKCDDMLHIKISGFDESNNVVFEDEPLLKMLVFEVDHNNRSYFFIDKKWYHIYPDFKNHVDSDIARISVDRRLMPAWDDSKLGVGKGEREYNIYTSGLKGWNNLDRDCVRMTDETPIEVCDLYNKINRQLIHVKKVWGSKTSYLFAQGAVSAEVLYQSQEFRDACITKWPSLFDHTLPQGHRVVYAIADNKTQDASFPRNLTFFSKVNLMQTVSRLEILGYDVILASIRVD
ncbi:MAG: DUF6119 family protein [Candidatus Omnitrophota bacterium]